MNYIAHMNSFYHWIKHSKEITPTEIVLYLSLFDLWNRLHFPTSFPIDFYTLSPLHKIQSKTTFYKALKKLETYGLITYERPNHAFKQSKIYMHRFAKHEIQHARVSKNDVDHHQKMVCPEPKNDAKDTNNCSSYNKTIKQKTTNDNFIFTSNYYEQL